MKVKVFIGYDASGLTDDLNKFIEQIEKKNMEIVDIKYSTGQKGAMWCNSALVMYRPVINYELKLWDEIPETLKASCIVKEGE